MRSERRTESAVLAKYRCSTLSSQSKNAPFVGLTVAPTTVFLDVEQCAAAATAFAGPHDAAAAVPHVALHSGAAQAELASDDCERDCGH